MPSVGRCVRALAAVRMKRKARCLLSCLLLQQSSCSWRKRAVAGRLAEAAELSLGSWHGVAGVWHPPTSPRSQQHEAPWCRRCPPALCPRSTRGSGPHLQAGGAALQLGASLRPQHRPGGMGSSRRLLPRAPCSAGAWLTRPLKRQKILLSAHSSRSVNPQSVQQQPSVVCCLQPHAASAPTRTGRSPGRRRRRVGITFAAPAPRSVPELGGTARSAMPFAASSGGVPRRCREAGWGAVG